MKHIIKLCEDAVGKGGAVSQWGRRKEVLHSNWETNRPELFANIVCCQAPPAPNQLCSICQVSPAVLRCIECGMQQFLCTSCDDRTNEKCPTHDRQAWINGYYQYILPTQTVNAESGEIVNMGR